MTWMRIWSRLEILLRAFILLLSYTFKRAINLIICSIIEEEDLCLLQHHLLKSDSRRRNSDYKLYFKEFQYFTLYYKNSDLLWSFVEAWICTGDCFLPASGPRGSKLGVSLQTVVRGGLILPASGSGLVKRKGDRGSRRVDVGRDLAEPR